MVCREGTQGQGWRGDTTPAARLVGRRLQQQEKPLSGRAPEPPPNTAEGRTPHLSTRQRHTRINTHHTLLSRDTRGHIKGGAADTRHPGTYPNHPLRPSNSTWEHFLRDKWHALPTCATARAASAALLRDTPTGWRPTPPAKHKPQHLPTTAQRYNSTHTLQRLQRVL